MRAIDLFCGIGGFHLGMTRTGFSVEYAADVNRHCQHTYQLNFGLVPGGDVTRIDATEVPEHEVLCAGFPCQPFSCSGLRRGFEDARGTLFYEVARLAEACRTPVVFLENVKGFSRHDGGRTIATVLSCLKAIGYQTSWAVLDAADFGVPQFRERTVLVASRLGQFDFGGVLTRPRVAVHSILEETPTEPYLGTSDYVLVDTPARSRNGLVFAGYRAGRKMRNGANPAKPWLCRAHRQQDRIWSAEGLYATLPSQESMGRLWVRDAFGVRKLSLRECYRLMGFPDSFQNDSPVTEQRRQVGNAVCPQMVEAVASEIRRQFFPR